MQSITDTIFIIKQDYHKIIKQYAKVKIITIINDCCLVEDIKSRQRLWIMKYEIYPINNTFLGGYWQQNNYYEDLYKGLNIIQ